MPPPVPFSNVASSLTPTSAHHYELLHPSAATASRYNRAVRTFYAWCSSVGHRLSQRSIDRTLTEYLHHLFRQGRAPSAGSSTVFGLLSRFPHLSPHLFAAKKVLKNWTKRHTVNSHPPIPFEVCVAIAMRVTQLGFPVEGLGFLLLFDAYLRIGELLSLRLSDIVLPCDPRVGRVFSAPASIRLVRTKTRSNLWVDLKHPDIARVLAAYTRTLSSRPSSMRVFPFSRGHMMTLLRRACRSLHIEHCGFVLHSFRHGGATYDVLAGVPIEDIMRRGRWASVSSARHYVQSGRSLLLSNSIPLPVFRLGSRYARSIARSWASLAQSSSSSGVGAGEGP
jgi:integrase